MKSWKEVLVSPETTIRQTIQVIDAGALQIALVVDKENRLLGTVTDGDIRRGILHGTDLEAQVRQVMNCSPTVAGVQDGREKLLSIMKQSKLSQIPVLSDDGHILGLEVLETVIQLQGHDNWVFLMAGGMGTRLRPLTDDFPKPLLKIGGKPILQTILENFIEHGFRRFYLSLNYKADLIRGFFGDGSRWGVEIRYIVESKRLGTAGALGLMTERPDGPIVVMNGDVLTKINFRQLLEFHHENKAEATMCVREYDFQVPYGVVRTDNHRLLSIQEKPLHRFFVNAGIYVLEPQLIDLIPPNHHVDMPNLFNSMIEQKRAATVFPIREYWLDVGQKEDFDQAEGDFGKIFE